MSEQGFKFTPIQPVSRDGAFSRASTATYFGRDGLRLLAAIDEPRFQFTPVTGAFEGLLVEAQATNRCAWSNDFAQAGWTANRVDVIPGQRIGADGELSMTKIAASTDDDTHFIEYAFDAAAGQVATVSVDVAAGELFMVRLQIAGSVTGAITSAVIDSAAGEVYDPSIMVSMTGLLGSPDSLPGLMLLGTPALEYDLTATIDADVVVQDLGNGICRVWLSATLPATESCSASLWLYQPVDGSPYAGDNAMGVYASAFDIRLSISVDRSSYIPTSGSEVTRAADINTAMLVSSIPENDYALYDAAVTYALNERTMIWDGEKYLIFQSVQAGNVGHTPLDESTAVNAVPVWWQYVGWSNKWRMFDKSISAGSSATGGISYTLYPPARMDSLILLNLVNAQTVRVRHTHPVLGTLHDQTYSLVSSKDILTYTDWFFTPRETLAQLVIEDMASYVGCKLDVDIEGSGEVFCGAALIGLAVVIGATFYGAEVGIKDYSSEEVDEFGNLDITERPAANTGSFQLLVPKARVDRVHRLFEKYRSTLIFIIGANEDYGCTYIYGRYTKYSQLIQYATETVCNVDFEGTT